VDPWVQNNFFRQAKKLDQNQGFALQIIAESPIPRINFNAPVA